MPHSKPFLVRLLHKLWRGQRGHRTTQSPCPTPGASTGQWSHHGWCVAWASEAGTLHAPPSQDHAAIHCDAATGTLVAAVCDGVSQGAVGHVASAALGAHWLAAPVQADGAPPMQHLLAADQAVADAIAQVSAERGATVGAALWLRIGPGGTAPTQPGSGWATRIGDCRVLLASPPGGPGQPAWNLTSLMTDQTLGECKPELYGPCDGQPHPDAEQPMHFAGVGRLGTPELVQLPTLPPGGLLLLASDGVWSALDPGLWHQLLQKHWPAPHARREAALQALANDLVHTAQAQPSNTDDATVLIIAPAPA